jgi:class 3 adenylate cyclase
VKAEWGIGSKLLSELFVAADSMVDPAGFAAYQRLAANPADAYGALQAVLALDVRPLLARIQAPALVIHTRDDRVVPMELGQEIAAGIRGARFISLPGAHVPAIDQWRQIHTAMVEFVTEGAEPVAAAVTPAPPGGTLRTVLFTDIVGHTEMMQRLGDTKGREVLREHERITRDLLKQYAGAEVKTMGDGFMASFGSVTKAMDCAIALQRAFAAHTDSMPEPLHVRVGLNAGEPIEEDGDLFGSTVILASRIAGRAGAGEILIPEPLRHLLTGKSYVYADRGEVLLKGFEDAVRLYEVRWRE